MSLSNIVDVQITRQTTAPTQVGFGTGLIVTSTVPGGFTERVRTYNEASELIDDGFLSTDEAYLAAASYFGQAVKPQEFKVGRIDGGDASLAASMSAIRDEDDDFYVIFYDSHVKADIEAMAAIAETLVKLYIASSDDADIITAAGTDVATSLQTSAYDRSIIMYSAVADTKFPEAAWAGLILPEDPGSVTWKFKTLAGITVDVLTPTEKSNAQGKNCNVYTEVGGVNITEEGIVASGEFIDVMRGVDWMTARIQENVYAALVNEKKIPYTDPGASVITNRVNDILLQAVARGILAEDPQYEIVTPLVASQSTTDRANRYFPGITFTGTLAGAIHKTQIRGTVSV